MKPSTPDADPGWALYRDWCLATGLDPLPATPAQLESFAARFPAAPATLLRRRRAVLRAHRAAGHPTPAPSPVQTIGADAAVVLRSIRVRGWPDGVSGRRDGFLIVMRMHLTRPQLERAAPETVLTVLANTPEGSVPGDCSRCALTRWLRVLSVASAAGWRAVQRQMAGQFPADACEETGHDCQRPLRPGWRTMPLLPAVDRHANVGVTGPISGRAITAATSRRRHPLPTGSGAHSGRPPGSQSAPRPSVGWDRAGTVRDLHWLDRRLDHLDALVADLGAAIAVVGQVASRTGGQGDGTG